MLSFNDYTYSSHTQLGGQLLCHTGINYMFCKKTKQTTTITNQSNKTSFISGRKPLTVRSVSLEAFKVLWQTPNHLDITLISMCKEGTLIIFPSNHSVVFGGLCSVR